ncbi:hypothetical protein MJD09_08445 [bacterium]|nr:hypothetical protein [bacterium]
MKRSKMKVLIYSQDGFGLGHLRRNLNICLQIKKLCSTASILIIADSPAAPFFKLPPQVDFVKLPTLVKVDLGAWQSDGLAVNHKELMRIRADIIRNIVLSFKPQIFLVDHMPTGALRELARPLRMIKRRSPRSKLILGLRDILGAPDAICQRWMEDGAYDAVEQYYDSVCIYGCADVFNLTAEYQFTPPLLDKTYFHGYVCRRDISEEFDEEVLFKLFPKFSGKFVLVTGGGGHDARYFMEKFLDAVRLFSPAVPFNAMIATGPFMDQSQLELLMRKATDLPVVVTPTGYDAIRLLKRADLVVSMCGYNTTSEILRFNKKAIVIPRPGPSAEQTMRSRIMSARGLFSTIHPAELTPANLAELVVSKLQNGGAMNEEMIPDLNGASAVASHLVSSVTEYDPQ